jgi:hypothetical protein
LQFIGFTSFSVTLLLLPIGFVLGLPGRPVRVALFWMPLFLLVVMVGALPQTGVIQSALENAAFTLIFVGLLFGWLSLPALLHPFTVHDLLASDLPARVRARLAFLSTTAVLPLGGIAVPLWMILRRPLPEFYERYRLKARRSWSRAEPGW